LESKIGSTMSISRFRPNIVIDGVPAYAEDSWGRFKVGLIDFHAAGSCVRGKELGVHPLTGEVSDQPLETLSSYRKSEEGKGVNFGFYYAHQTPGKIHTGQELAF
jgi:uncharacterized protein YcbX